MNIINRIRTFATSRKTEGQLSSLVQVKQDSLLQASYYLGRKEPRDWRLARETYHAQQPKNSRLQDLYQDALLDSHLQAVQQKRLLALQNKDFVLRRADGEIDEERSKWFAKKWFREIVGWALESRFFGYSLVWIASAEATVGELELELVDRRRVLPQTGQLRRRAEHEEGAIRYADYPSELLFACLGREKGLLEIASIATIMKRHSFVSWGEFEQIFGVPLRIAKVPSMQSDQVYEVERWLKDMGTAAYAVLPTATEIDIKESTKTDAHEVFSQKIALLNSEMSKLYLGQTMTTDDGSSLSQSQTHAAAEQHIFQADQTAVLAWLNRTLLPVLRAQGFSLREGEMIDLPQAVDPQQRLAQDQVLLNAGVKLSKKYLEETYDVEIDDTASEEEAEEEEAQAQRLFLSIKKKVKSGRAS